MNKAKGHATGWLSIILCALLLGVIISASLLAQRLLSVRKQEDNRTIISLMPLNYSEETPIIKDEEVLPSVTQSPEKEPDVISSASESEAQETTTEPTAEEDTMSAEAVTGVAEVNTPADPETSETEHVGSDYIYPDWDKFSPSLIVEDQNGTVWTTETKVDIFKQSYVSENGVTVLSSNGDKLIAPGTENTYTFWLKNNGTAKMKYTVLVEVYEDAFGNILPVEGRLIGFDGKTYLLGSYDGWSDIKLLDGAMDSASLNPGHYAQYTLDWRWIFDGDDGFDTYLGNLATSRDLSLTIVIKTIAELDDNLPFVPDEPKDDEPEEPPVFIPDDPSTEHDNEDIEIDDPDITDPNSPYNPDNPHSNLNPQTADGFDLTLYASLMMLSGCALLAVIVVIAVKKRKISYEEK